MNLPNHFKTAAESLFQTALREVVKKRGEHSGNGLAGGHELMRAANAISGDAPEPEESSLEVCAKLAFELAKAKIEGDESKVDEIENQLKFSSCDLTGWAEVVEEYTNYFDVEHKEPIYRGYGEGRMADAFVYSMPDAEELTVGVLGDWGTGEPVAEIVLERLFAHQPDLIIHVGDIYYSGTESEARDNFLDLLNSARLKDVPVGAKTRKVPVYNLPGNHDYYSGGTGFYLTLDELNKSPYVPDGTPLQEASFFCLRNSHWQLQGMDTGYYDHDVFTVKKDWTRLHDSEAAWHQDKINSAGDRKIILFSHHQFFSAFQAIGGKTYNDTLYPVFKDGIDAGKICAWFWGHEHLLQIYGQHLGLPVGACVGNGAFPQFAPSSPYKLLDESEFGPLPPLVTYPETDTYYKTGVSGEVYNHGYAVLKLGQNSGSVAYYEVAGDGSSDQSTLLLEQSITSS